MPPPSKPKPDRKTLSWLLNWLRSSPGAKKFGLPLLAAFVAYYLSLIPVSEDIQNCKICSPVISSGNNKLAIYNIENEGGTLFEFAAEPNQMVNIHFDKARLEDATVNILSQFIPDTPRAPQAIDFRPIQNKAAKIFVRVRLKSPAASPNVLYFSRELTPGSVQPDFKIKAENLDLAVEIAQIGDSEKAITEDKSFLIIGAWHHKLAGIQLAVIPEHEAEIAFRFDLPEWNPDKAFEAFFIPPSDGRNVGEISAGGIGIITARENERTVDTLLCAAPKPEAILWRQGRNFRYGACPLGGKFRGIKLSVFKIGKEDLQLSASGPAWVKINGELTFHVIALLKKHIENNPVLKQLAEMAKKSIGL